MAKLRDLRFSDILISENEIFLKGVPGRSALEPLSLNDCEDMSILVDTLWMGWKDREEKEFSLSFDSIRYRVSKIDTVGGLWFSLRKAMSEVPSLESLGFSSMYRKTLCSPVLKKGLIIFCGSMGAGKTTSASALVKTRLETFGGHAVTLEDPPELPLHGPHGEGYCLQRNVQDFGQAIIESLRYGAPEIIYLGELRSPKDVSQALRAAINGHLLISTVHAGNVIEAAQRLLSLGSAEDGREMTLDLLAGGVGAFVHQKLSDSPTGKKLQVEFLLAAGKNGQSVRSLLKSGQLIQLGSAITEQRNRMLRGTTCQP